MSKREIDCMNLPKALRKKLYEIEKKGGAVQNRDREMRRLQKNNKVNDEQDFE